MRAPDAGTPQRELQPATIREMPGDSPNNGELAPLYRVNDSYCASLFYHLPTGGSDLEANDLDRLGASLHDLAFCRSKPGAHEAGNHVAIEPMSAHKQCFGSALRAAFEQL
jgi:hypothetical protein